jgi:hypothetical protein
MSQKTVLQALKLNYLNRQNHRARRLLQTSLGTAYGFARIAEISPGRYQIVLDGHVPFEALIADGAVKFRVMGAMGVSQYEGDEIGGALIAAELQ